MADLFVVYSRYDVMDSSKRAELWRRQQQIMAAGGLPTQAHEPVLLHKVTHYGVYNDQEEAEGMVGQMNTLIGTAFVAATHVRDAVQALVDEGRAAFNPDGGPGRITSHTRVDANVFSSFKANQERYLEMTAAWGELRLLDPRAECDWIERRIELHLLAFGFRPYYQWEKAPMRGWRGAGL